MYTAWEKVRELNSKKFGINSPVQPELFCKENEYSSNLEKECLSFIRNDCEELRFSEEYADCKDLCGDSIGKNQIPFNMQKDTDRLCFERAIHKFMLSGAAEDAFDIYFCYLEMFIGEYGQSKKMIEMLAEFEMNASSLLMKHRDHYSHSAYVFILGLAIFHNNEYFRKQYKLVHMKEQTAAPNQVANHFLKYWGLTSLFHDIGYPFEIPFEQVKSYFGDSIEDVPFITYAKKGLKKYVAISDEEAKFFSDIYGTENLFKSSSDIIAFDIEKRLGKEYGCKADYLRDKVINKKPVKPDAFNGYMDHAVFSGIVLYKQLTEVIGYEMMDEVYINCLSAITLHNSMFKFSVRKGKKKKPLPMELHPLAYMLMLCDELQCWDRTSYGQNSRSQLHPMWFDAEFDGKKISATYYYNKKMESKKDSCTGTYEKMKGSKFVDDIAEIIDLNTHSQGAVDLELTTMFVDVKAVRKFNTYLSNSNYIHLYNFAVHVHGRRKKMKNPDIDFKEMEDYFNETSLEYKLSVIERTKSYAKYLDEVGFFYTDKPVVYEIVDESDVNDAIEEIMGELEHVRWCEEKQSMGWKYGKGYLDEKAIAVEKELMGTGDNREEDASKVLRELTRTHKDLIQEYSELDTEETREKDKEPLREMLSVLSDSDGIRIYKLPYFDKLKELSESNKQ